MIGARHALADMLDSIGGWDWDDGSDHDPSDRMAVIPVRRLGAPRLYALVYRGAEPDDVTLYATRKEAEKALAFEAEARS